MRKTFFVFGIHFLSRDTLKPCTFVSSCTYEHLADAETFMSNMCVLLHNYGHVIVKAQVFKKVIKL